MQLVLPPGYRDYWVALEETRKASPPRTGVYAMSDPFEPPAAKPPPPSAKPVPQSSDDPVVRMSERAREMVEVRIATVICAC